MMPAGSVNAWTCGDCGENTVAIHVDNGVTPMLLACRATPGCTGRATSLGYPPPPIPAWVLRAVAWEWRKASTTELKRWKRSEPDMYQHCAAGGLVLRPLSDDGRSALEEYVS